MFTSDGYDLQAITLTHLLSHTSGMDSYTGYGYIDSIAAHPCTAGPAMNNSSEP
ncbi:MAG: hypothetical protein IPI72_02445 [Flavobacteriales bacterium]|nr:hypothetical protein [Flavobacteriales bacterium]